MKRRQRQLTRWQHRRAGWFLPVVAVVLSGLLLTNLALANQPVTPSQTTLSAWKSGESLTADQVDELRPWAGSQPIIQHISGPDNEGYRAMDSQEPQGPVFNWIDITVTGTEISAELGDEDLFGPIPIGFEFSFYNVTYTEVWVQSNGVLTFDPGYVLPLNQPLPMDLYGSLIAWFWDDMDPDYGQDGCSIYYETVLIGNEPVFILSVHELDEYPDGPNQDTITAQVHLYPDGRSQIHYLHVDPGLDIGSSTIGIQNAAGDVGVTYLYNGDPDDVPQDSLAVEFRRMFPSAFATGVVRNLDTGMNIPFALVTAQNRWSVADWGGRYFLWGLYPGGNVQLTSTAYGYHQVITGRRLVPGPNTAHIGMTPWLPPLSRDYLSTLEIDNGRMLPEGVVNHWTRGATTIEPPDATSGQRVWANRLNQDYATARRDWLTSFHSYQIQDEDAYLRYKHWFDIEAGYDGYNVQVSTNEGLSWHVVQPVGGYPDLSGVPANDFQPCFNNEPFGASDGWEEVVISLGDYVDEQIWLGFYFVSDGFVNQAGVAIDDLEIFLKQRRSVVALYTEAGLDTIPAIGGAFPYHAIISSDLEQPQEVNLWAMMFRPDGIITGPHSLVTATVNPGLTTIGAAQLPVHMYDPNGLYRVLSYVGIYPNFKATRSVMSFMKMDTPSDRGVLIATDPEVIEQELSVLDKPVQAEASLSVHPNPFNELATVRVTLPATADIRVELISVEGRRVATLLSGTYPPGLFEVPLEGRELASGIYFVRALVEGQPPLVRKTVVVK